MHLKWQLIWSACSLPQHPLHGPTDPPQWQAPCSSQVSLSCSPLPQISTCIALGLQKVYAGTACAARWLPNGCYSHFHCFLTHCHYLCLLAYRPDCSAQLHMLLANLGCKTDSARSIVLRRCSSISSTILLFQLGWVIQHLLPVLYTHKFAHCAGLWCKTIP